MIEKNTQLLNHCKIVAEECNVKRYRTDQKPVFHRSGNLDTWIEIVDDKSIAACELLCCRMSLTVGWTRNKTNGHELSCKVFINVLI